MAIEQKSISSRIFDIFNYCFLALVTITALYPMWYALVASFSDYTLLTTQSKFGLWFIGFNTDAYRAVFKDPMILRGYGNTLLYVGVGLIVQMLMTVNGAYILSRRSFMWRKPLTIFVMVTMFFSGGLIPTFLVVKGLGLYDSMWALILPNVINTWNMLIMRNSFEAIPESLVESARIDGADDMCILFRIILPMSTAILAVITLYYLVAGWNAWMPASIYIQQRERFPLQLILREILIINQLDLEVTANSDVTSVEDTIKYAAIMVATVPVLCVYPFLQKYFVKGIMVGAVKE